MLTRPEANSLTQVIAMAQVASHLTAECADELIDLVVRETAFAPVFIVIAHDRHVDDEITVHATRESADAKVETIKTSYERPDRGWEWKWTEMTRLSKPWVRHVDAGDDGPNVRIERHEVAP